MLQPQSINLGLAVRADGMRYPDEGDDFVNDLYVQDLIVLSAAKIPSRVGHRPYARCAVLWQFIVRFFRRRLG